MAVVKLKVPYKTFSETKMLDPICLNCQTTANINVFPVRKVGEDLRHT